MCPQYSDTLSKMEKADRLLEMLGQYVTVDFLPGMKDHAPPMLPQERPSPLVFTRCWKNQEGPVQGCGSPYDVVIGVDGEGPSQAGAVGGAAAKAQVADHPFLSSIHKENYVGDAEKRELQGVRILGTAGEPVSLRLAVCAEPVCDLVPATTAFLLKLY